jgi:hypothetical protein
MARRFRLAFFPLAMLILWGCGTGFELPNEVRRSQTTGNGTYERIGTWSGFVGVKDILLTKSANPQNEQLYILLNTAAGTSELRAYPLSTATPLSYSYPGIQNGVAVTGNSTRLFVLDQGDSCAARLVRPSTGRCDSAVAYFEHAWRVREYFPDGGDTVSTFTDTTMAWVQGIAVDDQNRVYVSGIYILVTVNPDNPFYFYRRYVWRVFRYVKGGTDPRMPGASWHRDAGYVVEEGSGLGTASDPRGLDWNPVDGGALFIADSGNNRAQRRSDPPSANDYLLLEGDQGPMIAPNDVSSDLAGFSYVIDLGHDAVHRFKPLGQGLGEFVQRVDVDPGAASVPLQQPVAVAADNDLVYVADAGAQVIAIYRRRK